jgi:phosphatidylserine/phosphatidylglycerophosphate/cardiolipin synthase-like enzyme
MKILIFISILLFSVIVLSYFSLNCLFSKPIEIENSQVKAIFSPGNSEKEIISLMDNARIDIKIEMFEFSYKVLKDSLARAKERGIIIKVILDTESYQNKDTFDFLKERGIGVKWSPSKFNLLHSKFAIIDNKIVLVGSTNWSKNGMQKNREASVIVYSENLAKEFENIFNKDWGSQ